MIISPAYAQAAGAGGPGILGQLLPFLLIFAVFYFLLIVQTNPNLCKLVNLLYCLQLSNKIYHKHN